MNRYLIILIVNFNSIIYHYFS